MLRAFVITLGDGLEAFLIVAACLTLLRRGGLRHLLSAVQWGIAISVATSAIAAWMFSLAANQALAQTVMAFAALVGLGTLALAARPLYNVVRRNAELAVDARVRFSGGWVWLALFLFTMLVLSREGMEALLLVGVFIFQVRAFDLLAACALGWSLAAGAAWLWARYGPSLDGALIIEVTVIFAPLFALQLFVFGLQKLAEAAVFPGSATLHAALQPFSPDDFFGSLIAHALLAVPLAWLVVRAILGHGKTPTGGVAHLDR